MSLPTINLLLLMEDAEYGEILSLLFPPFGHIFLLFIYVGLEVFGLRE